MVMRSCLVPVPVVRFFNSSACNAVIYLEMTNTITCLYTFVYRPMWTSAFPRSLVLYYSAICAGPCNASCVIKVEDVDGAALVSV